LIIIAKRQNGIPMGFQIGVNPSFAKRPVLSIYRVKTHMKMYNMLP
jgi:hypothetical protein